MQRFNQIKKPEMVFFDFGGTLFFDSRCDARAGSEELFKHIVRGSASVDDFAAVWEELCAQGRASAARNGEYNIEMPLTSLFRHIEARLGITLSLSDVEKEIIFDRFNSKREKAPYIELLLDTLHKKGIRAGVISNITMSGAAMKAAIDYEMTNNIELVVTSADYIFCKPYKGLFLCAASLAGVDARNCWYCGDTPEADIDGGHGAGMLPILYKQGFNEPFALRERNGRDYYELNSWKKLAEIVEAL